MKATTATKLLAALLLGALPIQAAITIPGADGSDGALNIVANTVIDLSQAVTGTWDANNTANAGKGIYDASKWAVVFKYSSVNVAAGTTVTFTNHPSRAPVVWLVTGNVTVSGTVSLNGQNYQPAPALAEPGPGGFRGGSGNFSAGVTPSAGFGPGGGLQGSGGSYGALGGGGSGVHGNPSLVPLLGGSGGGGRFSDPLAGGGAGGGAMLIACGNTVTISGQVRSNGGAGTAAETGAYSGGGSGGGIRLISDSLIGSGNINAVGGSVALSPGGFGRIRIERVTNSATISVSPDPSVVDLAAASTALIWPPSGAPEVKIVSIGAVNAPADPRAGFGTIGADVALPTTASTAVIIETTNVEQASQVKVRGTPRSNANFTEVTATFVNEPTPGVRRWTATLPVSVGYSAVQVRVIRP